jgi:hypothetical protein
MKADKDSTLLYFRDLKKALQASSMPKGPDMNPEIRRKVAAAKLEDKQKHLRLPEAAFINAFVIPPLFEHLKSEMGLSETDARTSLLNEYHKNMPETSSGSPIFPLRGPFKKALGSSASSIYQGWKSPMKGDGLTQCAPDFALRKPFPHSILFEGKFYASGSLELGEKQLAKNIYEAFFYRGLPRTNATMKKHSDWNYDYACLLAFDASDKGTLRQAWENLSLKIRKSFWEGGNTYVMILRE